MCKPAINSFSEQDLVNPSGVTDRSVPKSKKRMKALGDIEDMKVDMQVKRDHEL